MNKSLKQKRKQKRDAKRELKNHTNQTYTDDSIQETLRQIRLVQNQIIRQNKEKQTHEQKLAQSKNSPEQNTPNVNLKSISFIKNYTSKQNDHVDLQIQKKPTYVGSDWIESGQRKFTVDEHKIWDHLYKRQDDLIRNFL